MALWTLEHRIFEAAVGDAYPVIVHNFIGRTKEEAMGYYRAHLQADAFIRGCTETGRFGQVRCRSEMSWRQLE